ncbi:MAG: hypothetical protein RSC84_02555 [Peptostreptococcaceae bacterium]|uniref:hypothetical protein n=1 Tax=Clostridium sp. TaxID=1506 RepID=UPI0030616081
MKITSLQELKQISEGEVLEFPGFVDDKPFVARVRRFSLMGLATSGKIPNPLIMHAQRIFDNADMAMKGEKKLTKKENKEIKELENALLHEALVEPTYQEILDLNMDLSPIQKALIIEASQGETSRLNHFRNISTNIENIKSGKGIQQTPERNIED